MIYDYTSTNLENEEQWKNAQIAYPKSYSIRAVLKIPKIKGVTPAIYPEKYPDNEFVREDLRGKPHSNAGKIMKNWEGKEMEGEGVVFYNYKDNAFQFVKTDGNEVILLNGLLKEESLKINNLNLEGKSIEEITKLLNEEFKGKDMYNSTNEYVKGSLKTQEDGTVVKESDIPSKVLHCPGPCKIKTDAVPGGHNFDQEGGYVLKNNGKTRAVEYYRFKEDYEITNNKQSQEQKFSIKQKESLRKRNRSESPKRRSKRLNKKTKL